MPEGPEVAVVSEVIAKGIGKEFHNGQIVDRGQNYRFVRNGIGSFGWLKDPWVMEDVRTYGKLIRIDFKSSKEGETWSILNTLGMTGSWSWNVPNHKFARLNFFATSGTESLCFLDIRNFGTFKILTPQKADKNVGRIGWDLLKAPCDASLWKAFQSNKKIANRAVKPALLDQNLVSGLGNIYIAETLYRVGQNPTTSVKNVPLETWEKINSEAHQVLKEAYQHGGSTVETYAADGREGQAQNYLKVYNRKLCPQGHSIKRLEQEKRTTWYCPECQK